MARIFEIHRQPRKPRSNSPGDHPIDAVIGVNDVTAVTAAAVAEAVGLPHNSVASVTAARNKRRMRELLSGKAFPSRTMPSSLLMVIRRQFAQQVVYPCVVKPLILSASCGVIRANDEEEFSTCVPSGGRAPHDLGSDGKGRAGPVDPRRGFCAGDRSRAGGIAHTRECFSLWRCSINLIRSTAPSSRRRSM